MRVGNLIIVIGVLLVAVGIGVRRGWFGWFGHLPGDIRAEGEGGSFYFPITSSIVVSILLTLVINIAGRVIRQP
jgi:hypothetical protein